MADRTGRREEGLAEGVVESVAAFEIVTVAGVGLALAMVRDHVEDDLAEILAAVDAPFGQHGGGHRPVGFQGVTAQAVEQLRGADIAGPGFLGRPQARRVKSRASRTKK